MTEIISEYKFQHEQTSVLKEEAAAAIKKTEWLEYLKHRQLSLIYSGSLVLLYVTSTVLINLDLFPKSKGIFGNLIKLLSVVCLISAYLIAYFKLIAKGSDLNKRKYRMSARDKYRVVGILAVMLISLLFIPFGSIHDRFYFSTAIGVMLGLISELWETRRIKKNLIEWGILEPAKQADEEIRSIPIHLKETEMAIDSTFGKPKRKLFRKATMTK